MACCRADAAKEKLLDSAWRNADTPNGNSNDPKMSWGLQMRIWQRLLGETREAVCDSTALDETHHLSPRGNIYLVLLAFVVALIVGVVVSRVGRLGNEGLSRAAKPRVLGLVTGASNADVSSDSTNTFYVGAHVVPGSRVWSGGQLRQRLDSGVSITIDGPAEFEIMNEDHACLTHGRLCVDVPSAMIDFIVDTAELRLVGREAKFEVRAQPSLTEVIVSEGTVQLHDPVNEAAVRDLEFGTHRFDADGVSVVKSEAPSSLFPIDDDPLVEQTDGAVRYLHGRPQSLVSATGEYILAFRETDSPVRLNQGIAACDVIPGRARLGGESASEIQVLAGAMVESFMISFGGPAADALQGAGRIRFTKPVLGLIVNRTGLAATDSLFGGNLDLSSQADINRLPAWVSVSDDRRTLGFEWTHVTEVQQLRVLVDASVDSKANLKSHLSNSVMEFTRRYCQDCHSGSEPEAAVSLDKQDGDLTGLESVALWTRVHDQVHALTMPPESSLSPTAAEREQFLRDIKLALLRAEGDHRRRFGRSDMRRLNRIEYENTVRDLLFLPNLQIKGLLPPDGIAHGFDKSADALDISPVHIVRYLEAADHALARAIQPARKKLPSETIRFEIKASDEAGDRETLRNSLLGFHNMVKMGIAVPMVGTEVDRSLEVARGNFTLFDYGYIKDQAPFFDGVAILVNSKGTQQFWIKPLEVNSSGYYRLRVRGFGIETKAGALKPATQMETIAFYANNSRLLGRCDVPPNQPATGEITVWLDAKDQISVLPTSAPNKHLKLPEKKPFAWHHFDSRGVCMQGFELEGPLEFMPPGKDPLFFGLQKKSLFFSTQPSLTNAEGRQFSVSSGYPVRDAHRLLDAFAKRLLRRPVRASDTEVAKQIVTAKIRGGDDLLDAVLSGYRTLLCSPEFLLMHENVGELSGYALANRLSYFLWASAPDEELLQLAGSGDLLRDEVLAAQVNRLLDYPKSERFVAHFLDHWLNLKNLELTEPDSQLFPEYSQLILESMLEETRAYFAEMLAGDLGIRYLVDSDFLMINQPLAKLYQVPGVEGSAIRKVSLPAGCHRGGLLTQASVLKVTANGTITSPVVRGEYVLRTFLGTPTPPPPESVAAVEPDIRGTETIREQLATHREMTECARCHDEIDPPGFALESYDVLGRFRTHYRVAIGKAQKGVARQVNGKPALYKLGKSVDASGVLHDGRAFDGVDQFRDHLASHDREMARNLLNQFLAYSTGAPAGFSDREFIENTLDRLADQGFGARSMIHAIVQSRLFREK
ncbi:MAG: DUF1592 domain-containing protein [Planctomycetaceae bacterium]|nr:DUF1592 domain-containing protein [Planctomycetaceae bacterium]